MDIVRKESEIRKDSMNKNHPSVLRDFLNNSEEKLRRLKNDTKVSQDSFRECVEYFGESPKMTDANAFFSMLVRFTKAFKVSSAEIVPIYFPFSPSVIRSL